MIFEFISLENRGTTALITFKRPDCYNAMNRAMKLEIIKAIKTANKEASVRTIVLTGEGKAFTSGQDLNDRTVSAEEGPVDLGHTLETEWNPLVKAITQSEKLVLGAINGVVAGAGVSVALACDLIVAKPKTKFVSGFAQIALAPDAGSSHTMVRHLGYQRAMEFFLLGKPLMSEELQNCGLINQISEEALGQTLDMAEKLGKLGPLSVRLIKRNLQFALDRDRAQVMERETSTQRFLGASADYAEGVKAFFDKREPQFKGE